MSGCAMEVTTAEIASVIRLVREVCDLWDDPRAWREHLLRGACRILDGNVGSMHALTFAGNQHGVETLAVVGLPPELAALVHASGDLVRDRDLDEVGRQIMPGITKLFETYRREGSATAVRSDLVDRETFYAAPMYTQFRKPLDCDDYVVSLRSVDIPERAEVIDIDRPHGAAPFGPRELVLLKLLHDEIAPLVGVRLATESHLSRDGLSRRLNETLQHLLKGRSEKQVAAELGVSARTVHDYVSTLYRHFGVNSRAELMAYFIRREPIPK